MAAPAVQPVSKFSGDGVSFKAKLFGTADVNEPRGDQMCQTAINLLKAAVKTTGEHKQRIMLKINLSGIFLIDSTNQLVLYQHAINKISFISKDAQDNRAFGYVVGDKDNKHTFFGIRTEKAADQAIFTLRDLFQTVFDLKKREQESGGATPASAVQPAQTAEQPAATTTVSTPAEAQQPAPALDAQQPVQEPPKEVKREDSMSQLLDLLSEPIFEPKTQPTTSPTTAAWPTSPTTAAWPTTATTAAWPTTATTTQSDPFVTQTSVNQPQQMNGFSQPSAGAAPVQQQAFGAAVQPNLFNADPFKTQPVVTQPTFNAFSPQQQPTSNQPQVQTTPFGMTAQPQQQMFVQSPFAQQQPAAAPGMMVQPNQPLAQPGMFAQPPPQTQSASVFSQDPFFAAAPQTQQAAPQPQTSTNPFGAGSQTAQTDPFGSLLQPQSIPVPAPRTSGPALASNLFSDLNPLPDVKKDPTKRPQDMFAEVNKPPKPSLNELKPQEAEPVQTNNNPGQIGVNPFVEEPKPVQPAPEPRATETKGLIQPPPPAQRQRSCVTDNPIAVARPR